jgi:hypothetical protein
MWCDVVFDSWSKVRREIEDVVFEVDGMVEELIKQSGDLNSFLDGLFNLNMVYERRILWGFWIKMLQFALEGDMK